MRSVILTAVLLVACRSPRPEVGLPGRDIAGLSAGSGAVSAQLLEDPSAPAVQLGPGEEYTPPQLMPGNPKPEYPAELLRRHVPAHVIAVRVTFSEDAKANAIAGSPLAQSTEDQYTPYFSAAVTKALESWKCWPARIRKFRPGPDLDADGQSDYRILTAEKILKTYIDVSFSFEVINGQPVVKQTR